MVGVVFLPDGNWLHCGLTDGTRMIDNQPGVGVAMRPLPAEHGEIYWLGDAEGRAAWHTAWSRIGDPFDFCASFVCQCMGTRCILPSGLQDRLRKAAGR